MLTCGNNDNNYKKRQHLTDLNKLNRLQSLIFKSLSPSKVK